MKKLIHVLDKDKRKRKRVELFANVPAKIEALGRTISAKIKDVSYTGIGIVLSPNQEFPALDSLEAIVELPNQLFQGKVANRIILPNQEIKIGLSLPQEINKEVDFNDSDSSWDRVTDPETIHNIYTDLIIKGVQAPIEIKQNFSTAILHPIEIINSDSLICEISAVKQGQFEKGKAKCKFDLFNTCHAFETNIEKVDQNKIEIKLAFTLARLLRRETVRIQKKNANFELKIRLSSSELNAVIEEYEVFDYSEHGISMLDPEGDLSLPRNLKFDLAEIEVAGAGIILGKAEIRSYQWNDLINSYIVGLKFVPDDDPHLTNWHNLVLKARYPNLDFEYQDSDHKKIWELFERSGYLGLKPKESFDIVYDVTKKTWKNLQKAGTDVSKRIKITSGEDILAHIQIDKIYPKTWCIHHLSIDPKASKIVGKEIYSVTTDVILSEGGEYLLSLTEAAKPWNQRAYYDFISNYRYPEHNLTKKMQVYEVDIQKELHEKKSPYLIRVANKWDLKKIVRYFESHLSRLEIEACGLSEKDLLLEDLKNDYAEFELQRERNFLVALDNNENLLGFSRIETGTTGVNIFGLLDLLFIYSSLENSQEKGQVYDSLIHESLRYFQKLGKKDIILVLDDDRIEHYKNVGYFYIWDGILWIAKKDILPRYHAYAQLLYGHLILKRESIRKNAKK